MRASCPRQSRRRRRSRRRHRGLPRFRTARCRASHLRTDAVYHRPHPLQVLERGRVVPLPQQPYAHIVDVSEARLLRVHHGIHRRRSLLRRRRRGACVAEAPLCRACTWCPKCLRAVRGSRGPEGRLRRARHAQHHLHRMQVGGASNPAPAGSASRLLSPTYRRRMGVPHLSRRRNRHAREDTGTQQRAPSRPS